MRFEIKYTYPPHHESRILAWLFALPEAFFEAYPKRHVNNVYFDTADLEAFEENLSGISRRCKVRYRWYGPSIVPAPGRLEFKNKHASLGWKDTFDMEEQLFQDGDSWRDFRAELRRRLPPAARPVYDEYDHAALVNRYDRSYYESRDRTLRITLDANQEMFDQFGSTIPNFHRPMNLPAVNIMELKCDVEHRDAATRAISTCPLRWSRFSKYTVGSWLR